MDNKESNCPAGRMSLAIELSSGKWSKSSDEQFYLKLHVGNNTTFALATPRKDLIRPTWLSASSGPRIIISDVETKVVVATFQFEIWSSPDSHLLVASSPKLYSPNEQFIYIPPKERTVIPFGINAGAAEKGFACKEFMENAAVGTKYKIEIVSGIWVSGKPQQIQYWVWSPREGANVFEIAE